MPNLDYVHALARAVLNSHEEIKNDKTGNAHADIRKIVNIICQVVGYDDANKDSKTILKELLDNRHGTKNVINNMKLREEILKYVELLRDRYTLFTANALKNNLRKVINDKKYEPVMLKEWQLEDLKKIMLKKLKKIMMWN